MATFGQGVNASLGKTDYSNYLAGALQGARGVAGGGQAIGQGISNLGQQVGAGIEKYQKNKVLLGEISGKIEGAYQTDSTIFDDAPPEVQKMLKNQSEGNINMKDAAYLAAYAESSLASKTRKAAKANAELATRLKEQQILSVQAKTRQSEADIKRNEKTPDLIRQAIKGSMTARENGEATFNPQAFAFTALEMGIAPKEVKEIIEIQDSAKREGFDPGELITWKTGSGDTVTAARTSNNSLQIIPPRDDKEKTPAGVLETEASLTMAENMIAAVESGNKAEAMAFAVTLRTKNQYGGAATWEDLLDMFTLPKKIGETTKTEDVNSPAATNEVRVQF